MAYNKKVWMQKKEEEKKEWASKAIESIKLHERKPEDVKEYLDFMARMHSYSPRNIGMIKEQFPGAGFVAAKEKYQELGFEVLPDQQGIEILVPTPVKYFKDKRGIHKQVRYASKEEKELLEAKKLEEFKKNFFSLKPVYDITQTNAKPGDYPKIYPNGRVDFDVEDKELVKELRNATEKYLDSKGIPVTVENYSKNGVGAAKGYYVPSSHRISLNSLNTDTENMTVLIHETAHSLLHNDFKKNLDTPTAIKELEAEMTSYVVNKHFGIDTSEFSKGYIAHWTKNMTNVKDVESSLKNIAKASTQIISGIEENLAMDKTKTKETGLNHLNEVRLSLTGYDYEDYKGMLDVNREKFSDIFQSDDIVIRNSSEHSYIAVKNERDLTSEDLMTLDRAVYDGLNESEYQRTGKFFNTSSINLIQIQDEHLKVFNKIAEVTDIDLKDMVTHEKEYYLKGLEMFNETNQIMWIDNLDPETNKPMSFKKFKSTHELIERSDDRNLKIDTDRDKEEENRIIININDMSSREINQYFEENKSYFTNYEEHDEIYLVEGDDELLPNQKDTLLKNKSHIEIKTTEPFDIDRLQNIQDNLSKKLFMDRDEYSHIEVFQKIQKDNQIEIYDSRGLLGKFDKSSLDESERYFVDQSLDYFEKSKHIFLVDNNLNGEIEDIKDYMDSNRKDYSFLDKEAKPSYLSERLDTLTKKIGIDKDGKFKEPIVHLPEDKLVTPLRVANNNIRKSNYDIDDFEYEIFTEKDKSLFSGKYTNGIPLSLTKQVEAEALSQNKNTEFGESLKSMKKLNREKSRDSGMEKKLELGN